MSGKGFPVNSGFYILSKKRMGNKKPVLLTPKMLNTPVLLRFSSILHTEHFLILSNISIFKDFIQTFSHNILNFVFLFS
jgi:hypothetical protein